MQNDGLYLLILDEENGWTDDEELHVVSQIPGPGHALRKHSKAGKM